MKTEKEKEELLDYVYDLDKYLLRVTMLSIFNFVVTMAIFATLLGHLYL